MADDDVDDDDDADDVVVVDVKVVDEHDDTPRFLFKVKEEKGRSTRQMCPINASAEDCALFRFFSFFLLIF